MMLAAGYDTFKTFHVYCTHCLIDYTGKPHKVYHDTYDEVAKNLTKVSVVINKDPKFLERLKSCPHAGKTLRAPEAVQLMDEEDL